MIRLGIALVLFVLLLLGLLSLRPKEQLLKVDVTPAKSKVQAEICVAPWLHFQTCDGRGCKTRNPRSIA